MANLVEQYKKRLSVANQVYADRHNGERMDNQRTLATAKCLESLNKFMNEAFENSTGTQSADMGLFKKFSMNLTTCALPNLIAFDLVIVYPMSSMSGYINYIQYTAGTNKGETKQGDVFNSPFKLGDVDVNYTADKVLVEAKTSTSEAGVASGKLNWFPVIAGRVEFIVGAVAIKDDGLGKLKQGDSEVGTIDYATGEYNFTASGISAATTVLCNYTYNNVVVPQNDIPLLNAHIESMPLVAKARRVAVYYSQIAAFQAKQDYGIDLSDQLAEQAVGRLSYEIDTEVTNLLIDSAESDESLVWSKTLPFGVSKQDHYAGFSEVIEAASTVIYNRTRKFNPTYMLCSRSLLQVLTFVPGFVRASVTETSGPYFAGTLDGLKVFVTPNIDANAFVMGVNGNDMMSSAAVYAPYMAVVPTQLLQYADGGTSQGWSTMYDLKLLNKDLLVAGRITA